MKLMQYVEVMPVYSQDCIFESTERISIEFNIGDLQSCSRNT
jgi:hypothetical protein